MIYTIDAKATNALERINNLLDQSSSLISLEERQELRVCADRYSVIIRGDVPQSIEALRTGNYNFAYEGASDAAAEAMSCEEGFSRVGKSPISEINIAVHDVSVVAASINKIIISS
ncbi:hypothetical protein JCGZ_17203 [Jatropha curcas]|uniref:Pectinesterase inhibitor domain-containing protein n=2 Tax=Jatropha curcas TaxID=180498 RepID=A0A067LAU5_JATCU|nr:hypothetical protein JCGZ_17203 [Jatropha curcas]